MLKDSADEHRKTAAMMRAAAEKVARDIMTERPTLLPEQAAAEGFERGFVAALQMFNERFGLATRRSPFRE